MTRHQLFKILHRPSPGTRFAGPVSYVLSTLIIINCLAVSLETVKALYEPYQMLFLAIEVVSAAVFLVEYLCRLWVCVEQPQFAAPLLGRLRYALQPLTLLDLVVLLTFFAPVDMRFLRVFRLTRLLRVLHLDVFNQSMHAIIDAVARRRHLLVVSVVFMLTAVYCTAALIYVVEHGAQPEKFTSIPETAWWAVVTLTTIGYGDIAPITPLGKALTSVIVLFGIGVFALPTAILTAAILDAGAREKPVCPHCQNMLEP
ncbi:MAG: ion transporter [Pseudomonadota bacterium]